MKLKRTFVAPALVAATALVSGGWLLQRGVAEKENVYQQARVFDEVLHLLHGRHVNEPSSSELYRMAIDGMVKELGDPHTTFMTQEEYRELYTQMSGEYAGIGAQVGERDGWATVIAPLPGTPAERAGVKAGDRIVEVEGKSTQGMNVDAVVKLLRGAEGVPVNIRVVRFGVDEPIPFRLVREEIHLQSVPYAYLLGDGVGYVRLSIFNGTSSEEVAQTVAKLRRQGMKKLVLDLRENPGGLLEQGVRVSDLFLPRGKAVVETRGRDPRENITARATSPELFPDVPMVVLVDAYSASAAEIVAGALQDHDRALVVGATTYGKGSVQDLVPLSGGNFLKITSAKWYTPVGRSIQKDRKPGEEPDPLLEDGPVDETGTPIEATKDTVTRKPYRTGGGRIVYGGGGIVPDVILLPDTATAAEKEFFRAAGKNASKFNDVLFRYVVEYVRTHPNLQPSFAVTPEMRRELFNRLTAAKVGVTLEQYEGARSYIERRLGEEIAQQKFGPTVAAQRAHLHDRQVMGALDLLRRSESQAALFQAAQTYRAAVAGR
ncbi:MAG: S41 family peptidase [Gemmatimonadota bacterium]|nr:S41 family peptidase [Gemmatimonadota bacterium]